MMFAIISFVLHPIRFVKDWRAWKNIQREWEFTDAAAALRKEGDE